MSAFKDLLTKRRSHYAIGANTDVTASDVTAALNEVIPTVPTEVLDAGTLNYMTPIMDGAREAVGTILFFEDRDAVEAGIPGNPERRSVYKNHESANAQLTAWLALTELGLGANLQHFN